MRNTEESRKQNPQGIAPIPAQLGHVSECFEIMLAMYIIRTLNPSKKGSNSIRSRNRSC
ncbi:MAG: hypothetical protein ACTTH5_05060 [Wolinella sp.]